MVAERVEIPIPLHRAERTDRIHLRIYRDQLDDPGDVDPHWTRQLLKDFRDTLPEEKLSQFIVSLYLFPGHGCTLPKALFRPQFLAEQLRRVGALEFVDR
jgi:hypothetical protein